MKKILSFTAIILCTLLLLPLTALKTNKNSFVSALSPAALTNEKTEIFKLYNTKTQKTEEISARDYLFGVIAAEMPALYHEEALKAQAVAAYTFALYRKTENADKEYDITDNHLSDQSYISKAEAQIRWGSNAEIYTQKINKVLDETEGYVMTYQNKPILSVYHAISYGKTETAQNIWGKDYPYLQSVESYGDKLCEGYISTLSVPQERFKELLKDKIDFSANPEITISAPKTTDAGTVESVKICNVDLKGSEIRDIFSLRSSNFTIENKDGNFNFTVYGYGHSVGLSQNGADYMANGGSDFKEILTHYYKNCKIEKTN
jgi:stage II sporulation protein D